MGEWLLRIKLDSISISNLISFIGYENWYLRYQSFILLNCFKYSVLDYSESHPVRKTRQKPNVSIVYVVVIFFNLDKTDRGLSYLFLFKSLLIS